jgi:hypothetical protein
MAIFRYKPSQFFVLVPKSPIHTGLIYVKNPKPKGPFSGTFSRDWIGPCIVLMDSPQLVHMLRRFSNFLMVLLRHCGTVELYVFIAELLKLS